MKKKRESRMILNNNKNIIFTLIIMIMQSVHRVARRMTILVEVAISIICPKTRSLFNFFSAIVFFYYSSYNSLLPTTCIERPTTVNNLGG